MHQLYTDYDVPKHYLVGNRFLNVMHTRIRNNCSNLNSDLCNNYLREYPYCDCSETVEDAEHFFFHCLKYQQQRTTLLSSLRQYFPIDTNIILKGNQSLTFDENCAIFSAVQLYIKETKRFKTH